MSGFSARLSDTHLWRKSGYGFLSLFGAALIILTGPARATAQELAFPGKPPTEHWFVDEANLIGPEARSRVDAIAGSLWAEEEIPLYVVTIRSIAGYNATGQLVSIEYYAQHLFDSWGIGSPDRNFGMLLLVSLGDRKARIELGASWGVSYNVQAQRVMNSLIIPHFKREDYSTGIVDGVRGMNAMARGLGLPRPTRPWWVLPLFLLGIAVVIGVIVSLFRSGRKGWGWALIVGLGLLLLFLLKAAASGRGSGGGFGGGFSGGGGATGSW